MGNIKYNETSNFKEEKCGNKNTKNNGVSRITEHTEVKGNTYTEYAVWKKTTYTRHIQYEN